MRVLNKVLMSWRLPFAALIAAGLGAFAAPTDLRAADSPGGEASLTPHRAVYVLKLNKTREGGTITSAEGAMSIQMEKTCDGWVFGQSMQMRLGTAVDGTIDQDLHFSSWESRDFERYRFAARTTLNGKEERTEGEADLVGHAARFTRPAAGDLKLPEGTMFPVSHTDWLIGQARAGKRFVSALVFDGTDAGPPQRVTAVIGAPDPDKVFPKGSLDAGGATALTDQPGWPISMAFFELDAQMAEPDYEVRLYQLANGIATWLLLDFQDFAVMLTLEKIESLPSPEC